MQLKAKIETGIESLPLTALTSRYNLSQNLRRYANCGVNNAEKSFMKLTHAANFIKPF
jgi:hypothetical protein